MSPDMKPIIFTNMNVKLFSWSFTFHKVAQQLHIWREMLVLIQASSIDPFRTINSEKSYDNWSIFAEVIEKNKWPTFFLRRGVQRKARPGRAGLA